MHGPDIRGDTRGEPDGGEPDDQGKLICQSILPTVHHSTALTPSGPLAGCAISTGVMLLTYSPSISMDGSGLALVQDYLLLIRLLKGGKTILGHTQVERSTCYLSYL